MGVIHSLAAHEALLLLLPHEVDLAEAAFAEDADGIEVVHLLIRVERRRMRTNDREGWDGVGYV